MHACRIYNEHAGAIARNHAPGVGTFVVDAGASAARTLEQLRPLRCNCSPSAWSRQEAEGRWQEVEKYELKAGCALISPVIISETA